MKIKIKEHLSDPQYLEQLYRSDKKGFANAFKEIYPEISDHPASVFWKNRLDFTHKDQPIGNLITDLLFLILACLITGVLIKIPQIFGLNLNQFLFYEKNAALIVFLGLFSYAFFTKRISKPKHIIMTASVFIASALYVNLLPSTPNSDSINLVYIHLPLMLWCFYGLIFVDFDLTDKTRRIDYIKHNGNLAILMAIIMISGGILAGITLELFSTIGLKIDQFYFDYIVIWGLVSVPVVATFILRRYPTISGRIAPVIANIFSPLVLITLLVYLISMIVTGKNPYGDRDFLLIFNMMLLGVMAIIVFSISETSANKKQRFNEMTLLVLTLVSLIIDLVALSAIIYRLGEFGFTPNRVAVLGSNLLILGNLILILLDLFQINFKNKDVNRVELTIARYLPIYALWIVFVIFGFPLIFGLK